MSGRINIIINVQIILTNSKQVPVYIAEITPKNLRGGFAAVNQVKERNWILQKHVYVCDSSDKILWQLMICCGGSLAYLLGTVLTWRILAIIGKTISFHSKGYFLMLEILFIPYVRFVIAIIPCTTLISA